jgi:hypothetical protein
LHVFAFILVEPVMKYWVGFVLLRTSFRENIGKMQRPKDANGSIVADGNLISPTVIQCLYEGAEPMA